MNESGYIQPVEILLVEDNPADVRLTAEALREQKVYNHLHVATDGVKAMAFLRKEGEEASKILWVWRTNCER